MIRRYAGKFEVSAGCGAGVGVPPDAAGAAPDPAAGALAGAPEAPGLIGCIAGVVGSLGFMVLGFAPFGFTAPLGAAPL